MTDLTPTQMPTSTLASSGPASPTGAEPHRAHATRWWLRPRVLTAALCCVAVAAAAVAFYLPGHYDVETDDAFVQADTVAIAARVAAHVTRLHVGDNAAVKAGQLLVELDDRDFLTALATVRAERSQAVAARDAATAQLAEQAHVIASADAVLAGDRAALAFAREQLARYTGLAADGAASSEHAQQMRTGLARETSALQRDAASFEAARARIDVLRSQVTQANAAIVRQEAAIAQAELDLAHTRLHAPLDGIVASKTVQAGGYVQPGQTLFSVVPTRMYVVANIKETELGAVRPHQAVTFRVDAFPERVLHGHVDSIQQGTGASFALLPPENATGNFIKVVQRVPVKIAIDDPKDVLAGLVPGMSVVPRIRVRTPPHWIERWL